MKMAIVYLQDSKLINSKYFGVMYTYTFVIPKKLLTLLLFPITEYGIILSKVTG